MVYKWRNGRSFGVPAQVAGERLAQIAEAEGGQLSPSAVVEDATPEGSPLHPAFEWDNTVAAQKHREQQARAMLSSIVSVRVHQSRPEEQSARLVYVSVGQPVKGGACYVRTEDAMSSKANREHVVRSAMIALAGWKERYGHIEELARVVEAIEDIQAQAVA